ncbi:MAG: helix-turn-helix domain-containing protein [Pirellula sp.]
MANGQMGKRISEETKISALKLIAKGNSVPQVAVRLGVSQSVIRNWIRESGMKPQNIAVEN